LYPASQPLNSPITKSGLAGQSFLTAWGICGFSCGLIAVGLLIPLLQTLPYANQLPKFDPERAAQIQYWTRILVAFIVGLAALSLSLGGVEFLRGFWRRRAGLPGVILALLPSLLTIYALVTWADSIKSVVARPDRITTAPP
jgi:hypothetical protein